MKPELKEEIRLEIMSLIDDIMIKHRVEDAYFTYRWSHECGGFQDDGDSYCWHESEIDELRLDDWS